MSPVDDLSSPPPPSRAARWGFSASFLAILLALTLGERAAAEAGAALGFGWDPDRVFVLLVPNQIAAYHSAVALFRRVGRPPGGGLRPAPRLSTGVFLMQGAILLAAIGLIQGRGEARLWGAAAVMFGFGAGLDWLERRRRRRRPRPWRSNEGAASATRS